VIFISQTAESIQECFKNISNQLNEWVQLIEEWDLAEFHRLNISNILEVFCSASENLSSQFFDIYCAENNAYQGEQRVSRENMSRLMASAKSDWLQSVIEIDMAMEKLPKEDKTLTRNILKGYELMFNCLIGFHNIGIFSKDDLSIFLNKMTKAKLISAYAIKEYEDVKEGTQLINPWNIGVKESLEMSTSGEGFSELLKCEWKI
jgi:hypothetical protein